MTAKGDLSSEPRRIGLIIAWVPLALRFNWVAFDSRKRGWHDMIGGTVVIRGGQ